MKETQNKLCRHLPASSRVTHTAYCVSPPRKQLPHGIAVVGGSPLKQSRLRRLAQNILLAC